MNYLKISIITPSYNQGKYIEACIQSVINQNYPNLEYIIIDGGSNDETIDIIKKYEKHIHYWVSEKDNGQSHAINKGFEKATGEIIAWLNCDDFYLPNVLHKVNECFLSYKPDLVAGSTILKKDSKSIKEKPCQKNYIYQIPVRMPFPQPSVFFNKTFLKNNFYVNENVHYAMDMELLLRCTFSKPEVNFYFTNDNLSVYNIHPQSKTSTQWDGFFQEWGNVFYSFCKSMRFNFAIQIIDELNVFKPTMQFNYTFNENVINKYESQQKIFLAYFLKYRLYFYLSKRDFIKCYAILNFFKNELKELFYKWNLFRYYFTIPLKKII
jgi:glycosyltransferase involved in cell wall biosynthesis